MLIFVAVASALVLGFILFWPRSVHRDAPSSYVTRLPFGPAEQAYAPKVRIENVSLSRAENFLHQEVTTITADLLNAGDRTVQDVELTVEFFDEMNQVVLRESRRVLAGSAPLRTGERRTVEISFEHIPSMWNMQSPSLRVTGLLLASTR